MSRHLTARFWFVLLVALGGLLLAVVLRAPALIGVAIPFGVTLALSQLDGWWPGVELRSITPRRHRLIEGDDLEVDLDLVDDTGLVDVEFQLPAGLGLIGPPRWVDAAGSGSPHSLRASARAWGATGPEWLTVATADRHGLTERVWRWPLTPNVAIHPRTETLDRLVPLGHPRSTSGDHPARLKGPGTELFDVREARPGDPTRSIHPRLSARRGTPMVAERQADRAGDVVLVVDSNQDLGVDLDTTLRWTISAAIALTDRHLRSMDRVGVLDRGHGIRWLPPRLGRRARHEIVSALLSTSVHGVAGTSPAVPPLDEVPGGATIVALSPLLSDVVRVDLARLRQRGHDVVVIQPSVPVPRREIDPIAIRTFDVMNTLRADRLRDLGVVVLPWDTTGPVGPVIARADPALRAIRRRG